MSTHAYHLPYGRNEKDKPDAGRVKELAAKGLDRAAIAAALNIKYKRLCYLITRTYAFSQAWLEGTQAYKTNASIKEKQKKA
jgi:hypothetical protein